MCHISLSSRAAEANTNLSCGILQAMGIMDNKVDLVISV